VPGLVVYAEGSPFRRTRRAEYRYPPVSLEAEEPYAPLLEPEVYDSRALVLVGDVYSVWPEVGGYRAESYGEMLRLLEAYMERSCSRRLPPRLCGRVAYRAHPWFGEMGGWRFNAAPGDPVLYAALAAAEEAAKWLEKPRGHQPSTVYLLYTEEQHPWHSLAAAAAAEALAAALGAELVEAAQWPQPYPRGPRPPLVETVESHRLAPGGALQRLLHRAAPPHGDRLLHPRGPRAPRQRPPETIAYSVAAAALARRCMLTALAWAAASAAPSPLARLAAGLREATRLYEQATSIAKKRSGGTVAHSLAADTGAAIAALAGAAALQAALRELTVSGWSPFSPLQPRHLEALASLTGCPGDSTPPSCLETTGGGVALRESCLRRLRAAALTEDRQP
jgi:hypothetical protein